MSELLDDNGVHERLADLDGWTGDHTAITRTAELPTFPDALTAVARVGATAEEMNHHPDIDIRWRTLTFTCSTHSEGGVTALDFELAKEIDRIVAEESRA